MALYAGSVLVASAVDPGTGGAAPGAAGPFGVGADEWLHALAYATLALLLAWARDARAMEPLLVVLAVAVGFGTAVEAVQFGLPARRFEVADALANAVGATVGVGAWLAGVRLRSRFTPASTLLRQ